MSLKIEDTEYKLDKDKDNIQGSGEIWTSQNLQCKNLPSRTYGTITISIIINYHHDQLDIFCLHSFLQKEGKLRL